MYVITLTGLGSGSFDSSSCDGEYVFPRSQSIRGYGRMFNTGCVKLYRSGQPAVGNTPPLAAPVPASSTRMLESADVPRLKCALRPYMREMINVLLICFFSYLTA
jgi:hypothetical protein